MRLISKLKSVFSRIVSLNAVKRSKGSEYAWVTLAIIIISLVEKGFALPAYADFLH